MKVALVHDWLTGMRGGERCLEAFVQLYPEADIHTLVHIPGSTTSEIDSRVKGRSVLNKLPGIGSFYRALLPLFPVAARTLDLSRYDLVISLSHAAAKNVYVRPGVPHVCYCFTPMRYIWDQAPNYFRGVSLFLAQPFIQVLRAWDRRGADQVTEFVAISSFVAARIRKFYGRRAHVIPPPVRMENEVQRNLTREEWAFFEEHPEPFFLCAGALVPYKRIDVAIEAFNEMGLPLWIVGKGPETESLRAKAGPSIRFLGHVSEAFLWEAYRRCQALIFPGIEDFGIVPVECLASGRPVIGVQAGGVSETVHGPVVGSAGPTVPERASGVLIQKSQFGSAAALQRAVRFFCSHAGEFKPEFARARAREFCYERFFASWRNFAQGINIYPGQVEPLAHANYESSEPVRIRQGSC